MSSNRGHRAGQCAPEVLRTRIRARGDLQERRTRPSDSHIQHPTPATWQCSSLIQHPTPAPWQCSSLIQHSRPAHPGRQQPHSAEIRRWRRQRWRRQLQAALGCEQKGTLKTFWFRGLFSNFAPDLTVLLCNRILTITILRVKRLSLE